MRVSVPGGRHSALPPNNSLQRTRRPSRLNWISLAAGSLGTLLDMRYAFRSATLLFLLLGAAPTISCSSPTEPEVANVSGVWEEATTICGDLRRTFLVIRQSGADITTQSGALQADIAGHISGNTISFRIAWWECAGSAEGTATISSTGIYGHFTGTGVGTNVVCCGTVNGTIDLFKGRNGG